jgi:hypothetical protein
MPLWATIWTFIAILAIDYFIFGQCIISVLTSLAMVYRFLSLVRSNPSRTRTYQFRNAALFFISGLVGIAFTLQIQTNAATQAERVIAAVYQFRQLRERYPQDLDELVPRHLETYPRVRASLMSGHFGYHASKNSAILTYFIVPPVWRRSFSFSENRWIEAF